MTTSHPEAARNLARGSACFIPTSPNGVDICRIGVTKAKQAWSSTTRSPNRSSNRFAFFACFFHMSVVNVVEGGLEPCQAVPTDFLKKLLKEKPASQLVKRGYASSYFSSLSIYRSISVLTVQFFALQANSRLP